MQQVKGEKYGTEICCRDGQPNPRQANKFWQQPEEKDDAGKIACEGADGSCAPMGNRCEKACDKNIESTEQKAQGEETESLQSQCIGGILYGQKKMDQ